MGTSAGFVGCLRDFKLGRRPVALHSDHDPTVMVRACASRFCGFWVTTFGFVHGPAPATWHATKDAQKYPRDVTYLYVRI